MAFIISIATHKGGTGKSTTSMAIAAAFARCGSRTLLVDLDAQGHSTLGLGVDVPDNEPTLRDIFTEPPSPIAQVIKHTHLSALDILPSNIRLERVAQLLYTRPKREELLKRALRPVASEYEFIVLDCPPSLSPLTETGIGAADLIIVPCQMEARAADGLVDLLEIISIIKGEEFTHWRILLTKLDTRKSTTNQAITEALSEQWADKMFRTTIPVSEPLNQAQIARTDIFTFDPKCKGALAYETLVQLELLPTYGKQKESTTQAAR